MALPLPLQYAYSPPNACSSQQIMQLMNDHCQGASPSQRLPLTNAFSVQKIVTP